MENKYCSEIYPKTEDEFIAISALLKSKNIGRAKSWGYEIVTDEFCISIFERSSKIFIVSENNFIKIDNIIYSHVIKEFFTA